MDEHFLESSGTEIMTWGPIVRHYSNEETDEQIDP